jgi:Crinkler effector protein N-terminal domain
MSTTMIPLNCLVYGDEPAFSRILRVEVDRRKAIVELRRKIWEEKPAWYGTVHPDGLVLHAPKTPIPTASKAEFYEAFGGLNLGMPDGRNSELEELNVTNTVADYPGLLQVNRLHVIAFLLMGMWRWSCLDDLTCY